MRSYLLPSILFITDIVTIVIVAFISLFIRFDGHIEPQYINQMVDALPLLLISYMLMFLIMHLYTRIWRYAGMREVLAVFVATTIGTALFYSSMFVFGKSLPRSVYFITWFLTTGAVGMGRMLLHYVALHYSSGDDGESGQVNTLIIGAGDAGATIAREIERYHKRSRRVIGYVDEEPVRAKITGTLRGILKTGLIVSDHFKLADVDARCEESHCYSISDKSLAVGGGVLEAVTAWDYERNKDGKHL